MPDAPKGVCGRSSDNTMIRRRVACALSRRWRTDGRRASAVGVRPVRGTEHAVSLPAWRSRAWSARAVKLIAILRYAPYRRALRFSVAASTEHARTPLPHNYATVIDVGANRGQFALLATRRFPGARLVCFEPLAGPRATLERIFTNRTKVCVVDAAVGASARETSMFVSRADDSSSLLAPTELQLSAFPGTDVIKQVGVRTERLDVLLRREEVVRPALLKIDVQGGELDVLTGASGLLDDIDTILVECSFLELYEGQAVADEVVRFLQARAFVLASVTNPYVDRDGVVIQADFVFARERAS